MCTMHHPACHLQSVESGPNADQVHCSNQRTQFVICAILWSLQHFNHDLCNIVIIICARFLLWFLHCCDLYKIVNVICGPIVDCALWGNQCWSSWGQGLLLLFRPPFLHTPLLHTPIYNKTILGTKRHPAGIFFFGHFLVRLSESDHSRV